jgi:hypothetical protein
MSYRIVNSRGTFLTGFFPNGGWKIGDVFAFSKNSWFSYKTEKEVQERLLSIIEDCKKQADRWGDWTDTAVKFAKSLSYQLYNN